MWSGGCGGERSALDSSPLNNSSVLYVLLHNNQRADNETEAIFVSVEQRKGPNPCPTCSYMFLIVSYLVGNCGFKGFTGWDDRMTIVMTDDTTWACG